MSASRRCYKLTDEKGQTYGGTQWGPGVRHNAKGDWDWCLCTNSWIHFYDDPILGLLMNPIHAVFKNPRVWEAEYHGDRMDDMGLKSGARGLTTIREITGELPEVTDEMRVRFAIFCAGQGANNPTWWQEWAARRLGPGGGRLRGVAYVDYTSYAANAAVNADRYAYATAHHAASCAEAAVPCDLIWAAHEAVYGIWGT